MQDTHKKQGGLTLPSGTSDKNDTEWEMGDSKFWKHVFDEIHAWSDVDEEESTGVRDSHKRSSLRSRSADPRIVAWTSEHEKRWKKPTEPGAQNETATSSRKWNVDEYDAKFVGTGIPALLPTNTTEDEDDEDPEDSWKKVDPSVAGLPPGVEISTNNSVSTSGAVRNHAPATVRNYSPRPGAVAVRGPDCPSVNGEELWGDCDSVSSSVLPVAASVVGDNEERLEKEVKKLQHLEEQMQNAPVAQVVKESSRGFFYSERTKRLVLVAGVILEVVIMVVVVILISTSVQDPSPLMDLIANTSPVNGEALSDPLTPQGRALSWLEGNKNLGNYTDQQKIQRYVLATLYYSTKGELWKNSTGWLSDESECDWYRSRDEGEQCIDGALVALSLADNNLKGAIPREISLLSKTLSKSRDNFALFQVVILITLLLAIDAFSSRFKATE